MKGIFETLWRILLEVSFVILAICQMKALRFHFFGFLAQVAPENRLYFVSEFIAFSVLSFIFFQKESCVDVNVSDTSSGEDNLSF